MKSLFPFPGITLPKVDVASAHRSPLPLIKHSLQGFPPCPDKLHTKNKSPGIGLYLPHPSLTPSYQAQ